MNFKTSITGFPRMGENRELKKALENYWACRITAEELDEASREIRKKHWLLQKELGISLISCNDFSLYDGMLDTAVMLNAVPDRFRHIAPGHERYFAMARGTENAPAMEMTKWFNTNYHYIVPELGNSENFTPNVSKIINEYSEAAALGIRPKINIIGPFTFLGLSRNTGGKNTFDYMESAVEAYCGIIEKLSELDTEVIIQFDEPFFVKDPSEELTAMLAGVYGKFSEVKQNVKIIFSTYFEHSCEATAALEHVPLWGLGLDFVHGPLNINALKYAEGKKIIAGTVDGRNVWVNNLGRSLELLEDISEICGRENVIVSTGCSLQHVPFSAANEPESAIKHWMSFAVEKLSEVSLLARLLHSSGSEVLDVEMLKKNSLLMEEMKNSVFRNSKACRGEIPSGGHTARRGDSEMRKKLQCEKNPLPELPMTTIGSFPQTPELRKIRHDYKTGEISRNDYDAAVKKYIDECISFQEQAGLDVLVHGEPERNDMVEYFGEMLDGFHFTSNGWVQSYGSRCVKPPVIFGDVCRPEPMTVGWITYAQSRTEKPVKGMLTGPVTILNWSFVRDDRPRKDVSRQIALALMHEIDDLQKAGISIIQVDEAAFKEGYPLRKNNVADYEKMAVDDFRLACSLAEPETQIHTHMCYSDFNDIIVAIDAMDADVITIETARSGNRLLEIFRKYGYSRDVGPGIYDIHSARIPSVAEMEEQIRLRMEVLPHSQLWVNPDCGLKTRKWDEVRPALANMVAAVINLRSVL